MDAPQRAPLPFAGRSRRTLRIVLTLGALALLLVAPGLSTADAGAAYRGRRLTEVLEELRGRGLNVIFSTAVVTGDLVVTVEPDATDPRLVLEAILAPLGLAAREGPGGSILLVKASDSPATGSLRGRVLSAARGRPLAGASVRVTGADAQASTLPDGTFELEAIPAGTYDVTVEAPGFTGTTIGAVKVGPKVRRRLIVTLQARSTYVEQIVVTPSTHSLIQQEQDGRRTIGADDAVLIPALGGDVSRIIEQVPGVAAADNSAAFNVRGAEARDVSLILDGLELYAPFHLQAFQSPFSVIDSEIVDTFDFLGGGFTAEFGDRHGGFVNLSTALPASDGGGRVEAGTVNSSFAYGATTPAGSLLVAARAWYPEAVRNTIELGEPGLNPRFEDVYLKLSTVVSPSTVLSFHGLYATDRLEFDEPGGGEQVDADDQSVYFWLRALNVWSPTVTSETVVSGGRLDRNREGVSEPEDEPIVVEDRRSASFYGITHDQTWQIADSHLLKGGLQVRPLSADYRYTVGPPAAPIPTDLDPSGTSVGAYAAYRAAWTGRFATEVGFRWDRQAVTDDSQFSPRLNAVWRMGERSEWRAGIGRYYQSQRIHELRVESGETTFLPAELSRQIDLTWQFRSAAGWRIRFDAYYETLSSVKPRYENLFNPIELFPETEADRVEVAPDKSRLRGGELLVQGDPQRQFYWWASYAWSAADDVIDGTAFPRSWDQPHAGKFLVGWRPDLRWTLSLSGSVHTGWPTTPVTAVLDPGTAEIVSTVGTRNSERFPTYARFDLKASRSFPMPRGLLRLDLEVINLADRKNPCCVDEFLFTENPDGSVSVDRELDYWLGITPSFSILWEF